MDWYYIDSYRWVQPTWGTTSGWTYVTSKGPFFADRARAASEFSAILAMSPINSYVRTFIWNGRWYSPVYDLTTPAYRQA